jgi:hypothetical protein
VSSQNRPYGLWGALSPFNGGPCTGYNILGGQAEYSRPSTAQVKYMWSLRAGAALPLHRGITSKQKYWNGIAADLFDFYPEDGGKTSSET